MLIGLVNTGQRGGAAYLKRSGDDDLRVLHARGGERVFVHLRGAPGDVIGLDRKALSLFEQLDIDAGDRVFADHLVVDKALEIGSLLGVRDGKLLHTAALDAKEAIDRGDLLLCQIRAKDDAAVAVSPDSGRGGDKQHHSNKQ